MRSVLIFAIVLFIVQALLSVYHSSLSLSRSRPFLIDDNNETQARDLGLYLMHRHIPDTYLVSIAPQYRVIVLNMSRSRSHTTWIDDAAHDADVRMPFIGDILTADDKQYPHWDVAMRKRILLDPMRALLLHVCKSGDGVGPDLGGGLTLDPDLNHHERQLLLDLKVRMKGNGLQLRTLKDGRGLLIVSGRLQEHSQPRTVIIEKIRFEQFLDANLPFGFHGDPKRATAALNVKLQVHLRPLIALLYNVHNIEDSNDGPDLGGGLTLYEDLNEEDRRLLLDVKEMFRLIWPVMLQDPNSIANEYSRSERLKQFFEAELPESLRDDAVNCIDRLNQFVKSDLPPSQRTYPSKVTQMATESAQTNASINSRYDMEDI